MTVRPSHRVLAHRRRPLPILAFVVAAVAAFLMPAVRPDPVDAQATARTQATLTVLTSPVEVQRASGNRDLATSGVTVVVGDRVFTGSGGTALLTFFQGTEVEIGPETELMVQEMTQRQSGASTVSFGQAVGSTVAKVASLFNPASRVQVSTQSAVAVVRGTEVETTVTKEKVQVFRSISGNFDVVAGAQVQRVKDGEVTVVPPPPPAPAPPPSRDVQSIGNATISLPGGNDRPPLPPVPAAEARKLFEKLAEITAKDGPPVVVAPPASVRDQIEVARGTRKEARRLDEERTPAQETKVAAIKAEETVAERKAAELKAAERKVTATARPAVTPTPVAKKVEVEVAVPVTESPSACLTPASTATPGSRQVAIGGRVVDGDGAAISCAMVKVGAYEGSPLVTTQADKSGAFRAFLDVTSSATRTFAVAAYDAAHVQQAVPTATAADGQLVTLPSPVILRRADSVLIGSVWSGASSTPATGATASVGVAVPPPSGVSTTLMIPVTATAVAAGGGYRLSVASGTYSALVASQENVAPYAYRSVQAAMPTVLPSPSTNSPIDVVLPTLDVSSAKTCQQYGGSCSITVAGKGWTSTGAVSIVATDSTGTSYDFGSVTPTNGDFTSQVLTSSTSQWPTGSYTIYAFQGSVERRYVKLLDNYVVADTTAPTVTGVTTTSSGTKRAGETVSITVTFSKPITTTGSPTLLLETGTTDTAATCTPVTTASTTLACTYTVVSSDASSRLDYQSTSALSGTIRDVAGNAATLTLPALGSSGLYSANVVVDALAPTITAVTTTANGTKSVGDTVTIAVVFSEAITTTATSSLLLETGTTDTQATCPAVTASTTLTCTYTVALGDSSTHLDYVATNSLTTSGTVRDAAGNDAGLTLPATGTTGLYSASIIVTGTSGTCGTDRASAVQGSVTISGQVTDAQSVGVAYACVQVTSYSQSVSGYPVTKYVASDANGNYTATFNASPGIFYVQAKKSGYTTASWRYIDVASTPATANVALFANTTISGYVYDGGTSNVVTGATIYVMAPIIDDTSPPIFGNGTKISVNYATSDTNGAFSIGAPTDTSLNIMISHSSSSGYFDRFITEPLSNWSSSPRSLRLPRLEITAGQSCTQQSSYSYSCTITGISGSGWLPNRSLRVFLASDPSASGLSEIGTITTTSTGEMTAASVSGTPNYLSQGANYFRVTQDGASGEVLVAALSSPTYQVNAYSASALTLQSRSVVTPAIGVSPTPSSPSAASTATVTPTTISLTASPTSSPGTATTVNTGALTPTPNPTPRT